MKLGNCLDKGRRFVLGAAAAGLVYSSTMFTAPDAMSYNNIKPGKPMFDSFTTVAAGQSDNQAKSLAWFKNTLDRSTEDGILEPTEVLTLEAILNKALLDITRGNIKHSGDKLSYAYLIPTGDVLREYKKKYYDIVNGYTRRHTYITDFNLLLLLERVNNSDENEMYDELHNKVRFFTPNSFEIGSIRKYYPIKTYLPLWLGGILTLGFHFLPRRISGIGIYDDLLAVGLYLNAFGFGITDAIHPTALPLRLALPHIANFIESVYDHFNYPRELRATVTPLAIADDKPHDIGKLIKDLTAAFGASNTVRDSNMRAVLQKIALTEETAQRKIGGYGLACKATGDRYSVELTYPSGTRSTGTGETFDEAYNKAKKNSGIASKEIDMSITLQRGYNLFKK